MGIATAFLTLHVGAGTYRPMRVEKIADHRMHGERFEIPAGDGRCHRRHAGSRQPRHRRRHDQPARPQSAASSRAGRHGARRWCRDGHFHHARLPLPGWSTA